MDRKRAIKSRLSQFEYGFGGTPIYLVGSLSNYRESVFNSKLSDTDIVVVPEDGSLVGCEAHLKQTISLAAYLNASKERLVDVFFLPGSITDLYLNCLSVYWGRRGLRSTDLLTGRPTLHHRPQRLAIECQKALYVQEAIKLCDYYKFCLPIADTSQARKVAKRLLISCKLLICAAAQEDILLKEEALFSVHTFADAKNFLGETNFPTLKVGEYPDVVLKGHSVENWPAWMIAQEEFAQWLTEVHVKGLLSEMTNATGNGRLFIGICRMYDMLAIQLKNIVMAKEEEARTRLIGEFADRTASVIASLAWSGGVTALVDFEKSGTPEDVARSHEILVQHLQSAKTDIACLAASVTLLEYAFQKGIVKANSLA